MVQVMEMAKLMDNYIVDDRRRGHHAFPVEGEVASWRAGGQSVSMAWRLCCGRERGSWLFK
jgi:hypothetical protein